MFIGLFKRKFVKDRFIFHVLQKCGSPRILTMKDFRNRYKYIPLIKCKKIVDKILKFKLYEEKDK